MTKNRAYLRHARAACPKSYWDVSPVL